MEQAFGIDLGTTYSAIGFMTDVRNVQVVADGSAEKWIPSFVCYSPDGPVFGEAARDIDLKFLDRRIYDVKRFIGRRYSEISADVEADLWPFRIVPDPNDRILIEIPGDPHQHVEPWQVLSDFFRHLLSVGNKSFPEPGIHSAVITVPAYFNDSQRAETRRAAVEAGIEVLRIMNEPTAAAVAVRWLRQDLKSDAIVLIFDFGGGTLDVSLLRTETNSLTVLATAGDTHLGGRDIDNCIVKWACDEFVAKNPGCDIDAIGRQRVFVECEKAKMSLSKAKSIKINVPHLVGATKMLLTLNRAKLNDLCADIFAKCIPPVTKVLEIAKLQASDVAEIILVGGSSAIVQVQNALKEQFPNAEVHVGINRHLAVVSGAAVLAAKLKGCQELKELTLRDVCPLTIGMQIRRGIMLPVIKRSTPLPVQGIEQPLVTTHNNQEVMTMDLYEGEYKLTKNNHLLAGFLVQGIPKGPAGTQRVLFTFSVTEDGILTVSASIGGDGHRRPAVEIVKNPWQYRREELATLVSMDPALKAQDDEEADRLEREFRRSAWVNNISGFFHDAENQRTAFARETSPGDRAAVLQAAERLPISPTWEELEDWRNTFRVTFRVFFGCFSQTTPISFPQPSARHFAKQPPISHLTLKVITFPLLSFRLLAPSSPSEAPQTKRSTSTPITIFGSSDQFHIRRLTLNKSPRDDYH
jgi:L1 cell adhesion molecule like protein